MRLDRSSYPITAVVYSRGADFEKFLRKVTNMMTDERMRLAGLIQHSEPRPDRVKCDMYIRDLSTGKLFGISEDRGPEARGCVLDTDQLLLACEAAAEGLSSKTDLLVLSKFGKTEAEGGGFRSLMARAMELSVPVLIGVPEINLAAFRSFSAGLAREIKLPAVISEPLSMLRCLRRADWPTPAEIGGEGAEFAD